MEQTINIFKSHYSIGRSILTLEKKGSSKSDEPDSIIDLAIKNSIKDVVLVEDSMSGFLEAFTNCKDEGLKLIFGWRVTITNKISEKSEGSLETNHKVIIMIKDDVGYETLVKFYTIAHDPDNFYYEPRLDCSTLSSLWNDHLLLCIPFYDSFLFQNTLRFNNCVPDIGFTKPVFFIEDNGLPFDPIICQKVEEYTKGRFTTQKVKSVYYAKKSDFKAYLTFKCIHDRSTLNKPEMEHMTSDRFCLE